MVTSPGWQAAYFQRLRLLPVPLSVGCNQFEGPSFEHYHRSPVAGPVRTEQAHVVGHVSTGRNRRPRWVHAHSQVSTEPGRFFTSMKMSAPPGRLSEGKHSAIK
jgi:hypothetical protein